MNFLANLICIYTADSLCCTAETDNIVKQIYPNYNFFKESRMRIEIESDFLSCVNYTNIYLKEKCM